MVPAMDIIERLRKDLEGAKKAQIKAVATDMGVPPDTLLKIVRGETGNPRYQTVKAIQRYYDSLPVAPMAFPIIHDERAR